MTIENTESELSTTITTPKIKSVYPTMNTVVHSKEEDYIHEKSTSTQEEHGTFMKPSTDAEHEIPILLKIIYFLAGPYDAVSKALQVRASSRKICGACLRDILFSV